MSPQCLVKQVIFSSSLFLSLNVISLAQIAPKVVEGNWKGTLEVSSQLKFKIIFKIFRKGEILQASVDSPDQNAFDMKATTAVFQNDSLDLYLKSLEGKYSG